MALASYSNLQTAVADWLNRDDLSSQIPDFIRLAEAEIRRILEADELRVVGTVSLDSGQVDLGSGVRNLESLALTTLGSDGRVEIVTPERLFWLRGLFGQTAGIPRFAALVNGDILTAPIPDTTYTADVVYSAALVPLETTSPNWLLTNHPDVYLYGALLASAPFIREDERLSVWQTLFDRAMGQLKLQRDRAAYGTNTPVGMPRRPL